MSGSDVVPKTADEAVAPETATSQPVADKTGEPLMPFELLRRLDFFQAVRVLRVLLRERAEIHPGDPQRQPYEDALRFRVSTSMAFPSRDLESIEWEAQSPESEPTRAVLTTHFLGLVGADSPLPLSYVQEVLWEEDEHPQLRAFLDMFHHRLLELLFLAWQKPRAEQDPLTANGMLRQLAALVGLAGEGSHTEMRKLPPQAAEESAASPALNTTSLTTENDDPDALSLRHLGLFSLSTRPAEGLRLLLEEALGMPVKVVPLRLRQVEIPPSERFRFGAGERRHRLSRNLVLGRRLWDRSGAITVEIGPINREQLNSFGPDEPLLPELRRRASLFLEHPLDLGLELRVPPDEMPRVRLGGTDKTRLGRRAVLTRARQEVRVKMRE